MQRWFGNRELSWLDFNERVLSLASEGSLPLLERVKFLAIFSSNLDEFFQVRVAGLKGQIDAGVLAPGRDRLSPSSQLAMISDRVQGLVDLHERVLLDDLAPRLASSGIELVRWSDTSENERRSASTFFEQSIFPVLTPIAVDPAHPFPYISNLSLSLGAMVTNPENGERRFARVKVPMVLGRFHRLCSGRYLPVEDIVAANIHALFVGMGVSTVGAFRVTRNADLTLADEDADDLLAAVEMELRRRRFGRAVRLEVDTSLDGEVTELLRQELELDVGDVSVHRAPLGLSSLWELHSVERPDLKDIPWPSVTAGRLATADGNDQSMFSVLKARDLLVHHPYESFSSSTEEFIDQAANDPRVRGIKITLYRPSGDSPIARSLITAAELGKQVVALIELTARFDEETNVLWARQLERAGVHVVYGVVGLKTHCKCVLVVRDEPDGLRRYVHVGTGNYNPRTARTYEDIGLFSCDEKLGDDVSHLFNSLTGFSREYPYSRLVVAPTRLRHRILELIRNESEHGSDGSIAMKVNAIADPEITDALYEAIDNDVHVDLVVRGICCLRPPHAGDHVRIRSVLGRYLEHSRIYRFGHGSPVGDPLYMIGSADMMPRNLDRRVEVLVPVRHPRHTAWLDAVLSELLADDVVAFDMDPDGAWHRVGPAAFEDAHDAQYRIQFRDSRAQRGPLSDPDQVADSLRYQAAE